MKILDNFDAFKEFLLNKVLIAEKIGLSDDTIAKGVDYVQSFLSHIVEPHNPEERLLQSLWRLGNEEERHALSKMILKLVKEEETHGQDGKDPKPSDVKH